MSSDGKEVAPDDRDNSTTMTKVTRAATILLAASCCNAFSTLKSNRNIRQSLLYSSAAGPIDEDIFATNPPLRIEGNSLKTWSGFQSNRAQVSIKSLGRPVEASVELWQTPSVSTYFLLCY